MAQGKTVGGFDAYTTSDVLRGSGLSSSAAFEMGMAAILNGEYSDVLRGSGLGLRGGFGGGGRGFVAARKRDGTDESGGGGGEKLGVECHDVVGVQLLAVSVLFLRALSYMYAVSRMAVRPTGLPSLRFPSFVR